MVFDQPKTDVIILTGNILYEMHCLSAPGKFISGKKYFYFDNNLTETFTV